MSGQREESDSRVGVEPGVLGSESGDQLQGRVRLCVVLGGLHMSPINEPTGELSCAL